MSKLLKWLLVPGIAGLILGLLLVNIYILPPAPIVTAELGPPPPRTQPAQPVLPVTSEPSFEDIAPEYRGVPIPDPPQNVRPTPLPTLVGRDLWDAQTLLNPLNLTIIVRKDTSSFELPNTVLRQTPSAGQRMFRGDTVYLTVSEFP